MFACVSLSPDPGRLSLCILSSLTPRDGILELFALEMAMRDAMGRINEFQSLCDEYQYTDTGQAHVLLRDAAKVVEHRAPSVCAVWGHWRSPFADLLTRE